MKSLHWTIAAGLALLLPAYCGLMLSHVPTLLCPFPLITVMPAFLLSSARVVWPAALVPSLLFFSWNPALPRGQAKVPARSLALLTILTALSVLWFMGNWKFGLEYQGPQFTRGVCAANVGWLFVLWVAIVFAYRRPSFFNNLLAHWLLFVWLSWYAFPYLGELP